MTELCVTTSEGRMVASPPAVSLAEICSYDSQRTRLKLTGLSSKNGGGEPSLLAAVNAERAELDESKPIKAVGAGPLPFPFGLLLVGLLLVELLLVGLLPVGLLFLGLVETMLARGQFKMILDGSTVK